MKRMVLFTTLLFLSITGRAEVSVVGKVDLERYLGQWFEIASIPHSFQSKCIGNVTANYEMDKNSLIKVTNSCLTKDGGYSVSEGRAQVVDSVSNAKLKVTFVKLWKWLFFIGGDYWIIDLDSDYQFAVVGHPSRDYSWILSRAPILPLEILEKISERLKNQGYDTCRLLTTVQQAGFSERKRLCDLF